MIRLPHPVSANRYWRVFQNRVVRSSTAVSYKKAVKIAMSYAGIKAPVAGPVEVIMQYHPRMTKAGKASGTRLDIDNVIKVTLDAMNGSAYLDDKQVVRLSVEIAEPVTDGGLSVWVAPVPVVKLTEATNDLRGM